MTKILAVNSNRDIYLDSTGRLAVATGQQAVLQACEHAAYALRGQMVLNADGGIPDFTLIWNGNPNLSQYEAALRASWLAVDGVQSIVSFNSVNSGNIVSYEAVIQTIYGSGSLNGTL